MLSNKLFICENRRMAKAIKNEDSANKANKIFFLKKNFLCPIRLYYVC